MPAATEVGQVSPRKEAHTVACPCLNVQVTFARITNTEDEVQKGSAGKSASDRIALGEPLQVETVKDGVKATFPLLTARETLRPLQQLAEPQMNGVAGASLRCINCGILVYTVEDPVPSTASRVLGFRSASELTDDSHESNSKAERSRSPDATPSTPTRVRTAGRILEPLPLPRDGFITLQSGLLMGDELLVAQRSPSYSSAFNILVGEASRTRNKTVTASSNPSADTRTPEAELGSQAGISSTTSRPSLQSRRTLNLITQLEEAAQRAIRAQHAQAEEEIRALIQAKSFMLEELHEHLRAEATILLDRSKVGPRANGSPARRLAGSASLPIPAASPVRMTRSTSGGTSDVATPRGETSLPHTVRTARKQGSSKRGQSSALEIPSNGTRLRDDSPSFSDEDLDLEPTLPSSVFERRRGPLGSSFGTSAGMTSSGPGATHSSLSTSISALSASFAMRGRDLPPRSSNSTEEWAAKRRLRERYPEGDHSALTSAATSAANSTATSEDERKTEDEREEAGRGRARTESEDDERGRGRRRAANKPPSVSPQPVPITPAVLGGISQKSRPSVGLETAPSSTSQRAKQEPAPGAASALPSTAKTSTSDRPTEGRFAKRGPQSPLKSARKGSRRNSEIATDAAGSLVGLMGGEGKESKGAGPSSVTEKKVAFAPTTVEVPSTKVESDGEEENAGTTMCVAPAGLQNGGEQGEALFEIDEDFIKEDREDEDDEGTIGSDGEIQSAGQRALELDSLVPQEVGSSTPEDGADSEDDRDRVSSLSSDEKFDPASVGVLAAGSFSALSASMDARKRSRGRQTLGSGQASDSVFDPSDVNRDGFDPASLRIDGRVVPPSSAARRAESRDRAINALASPVEQPRNSAQRASLPRAPSRPVENMSARAAPGTTIGFRVAVGEAEARLSGLLAPNVPSHRGLRKSTTERKRKTSKYQLDDEDDDKWAAWQTRVRDQEQKKSRNASPDASALARSVPIGIATPPGLSTFNRFGGSTTVVRDETSGFDLEPKTSLPYQERKMTPSLLKAQRRVVTSPSRQKPSRLPTIPDGQETSGSQPSSGKLEQSSVRPGTGRAGNTAQNIAIRPSDDSLARKSPSLPNSVFKAGFEVSPARGSAQHADPLASTTSQKPAQHGAPSGARLLDPGSYLRGQASEAGAAGSSPVSGATTPLGRRSPRPPYVPPPQPTSTMIRLQPDPTHKPGPLSLFEVSADGAFAEREVGEEMESDWSKVLGFMHRLERLKINKRTGWYHHRISRPESIADHMYRMAVLAMLNPAQDVDVGKCVQLALVHDMAEAEVGDLTPLDGVDKDEKTKREAQAMEYLVHDLLGSSPAALRLMALWQEYEARATKEAKLVKDLDRFELCLQALEYERAESIADLQPFYQGSIGYITSPLVRCWAVELAREREALWNERGISYEQPLPQNLLNSTDVASTPATWTSEMERTNTR
ncbi:Predicted hydrolases of HD superfamily [Ceraceosorus bombacis]|uniref:5'-deoxynucleotidase n=1 Tax=Ceraceosorus bombacis TaxID=401625 RepID=A0A0P1BJE6_9BASI|nr:Predicted hydrolases of HD superfamily [Ceraceosorus bombacis]